MTRETPQIPRYPRTIRASGTPKGSSLLKLWQMRRDSLFAAFRDFQRKWSDSPAANTSD